MTGQCVHEGHSPVGVIQTWPQPLEQHFWDEGQLTVSGHSAAHVAFPASTAGHRAAEMRRVWKSL